MYEVEKDWKVHELKRSTAQLKDLLRNTLFPQDGGGDDLIIDHALARRL